MNIMKKNRQWHFFSCGVVFAAALFGLAIHTATAEESTSSVTVEATVGGGGGGGEVCGNGAIEGSEQCDDSNTSNHDGCSSTCTIEGASGGTGNSGGGSGQGAIVCGNAQQEIGESCDDGNSVSGDGCSAVCKWEGVCGNTIVESGEACDDGNIKNYDGCSAACLVEACGNGFLDAGEDCDDGNRVGVDSCDLLCRVNLCGNGIQDAQEYCDDGNRVSGDGCTNACQSETASCAQQYQDWEKKLQYLSLLQLRYLRGELVNVYETSCVSFPGPECDEYRYNHYISLNPNTYMDNPRYESFEAFESYYSDIRGTYPRCFTIDTGAPRCGDGKLDTGEECDWRDPNTVSGSCSSTCILIRQNNVPTPAGCGDGRADSGEQCDDGNRVPGDGCSMFCQDEEVGICGNGIWESGEQCDDGNSSELDGCDRICRVTMCGNGSINDGEFCDDANRVSGDGCSITCQIEAEQNNCDVVWENYVARSSFVQEQVLAWQLGEPVAGAICSTFPAASCDQYAYDNRSTLQITTLPAAFRIVNFQTFAEFQQRTAQKRFIFTPAYCITLSSSPSCGDGVVNDSKERCDDGNRVNGDGCSSACLVETTQCGNRIIETGEQCDDGNVVNNDGCSATCTQELTACHSSWVDYVDQKKYIQSQIVAWQGGAEIAGQICATMPGPACDAYAYERHETLELISAAGGFQTADFQTYQTFQTKITSRRPIFTPYCVTFRAKSAVCGDTQLGGVEQCDDGNTRNGDGCSALCVNEIAPSCGDFILQSNETCDDGGNEDGDGCSSSCTIELPVEDRACAPGDLDCLVPPACENGAASGCEIPGCVTGNEPECASSPEGCVNGTEPECKKIDDARACITGAEASCEDLEVVDDLLDALEVRLEEANLTNFFGNIFEDQTAEKINAYFHVGVDAFVGGVNAIQDAADNPTVEQVARRFLAPSVVGTSFVTIAPSLSTVALPLVRYLFLQPLLFVGRRKKKQWGQIYDSYTRLPVDLALVRLIDAKQNRVVQSRVTDAQGRYVFIVEPGEYLVEVVKQGYTFPTQILKDAKTDGRMIDIYHGEKVVATEDGIVITPNIPLDPAGATKTVHRITWEKWIRALQHIISVFGIFATVITLYISPSLLIVGFLGFHVLLYGMFIRYIRPKKPKGWGVVYETNKKQPLQQVVARLFTKQYNKLVSAQITDRKGRYAFLVGPNNYYVTFEKAGYAEKMMERTIKDEESQGFINDDVQLEKQANTPPNTPLSQTPEKPKSDIPPEPPKKT